MKNPLDILRDNKSPFRELEQMQRNMDRLFEDLTPLRSQTLTSQFSPSCDVSEDKNNYYLQFDLPGIKKDQVKVELEGNVLSVSAERKEEKERKEGRRQFISEAFYGSYERSFSLPNNVDETKIDAKYEDGVLFLTVPKNGQTQSKKISVH